MVKTVFKSLLKTLFAARCSLCNHDSNHKKLCPACRSLCSPYPQHAFSALENHYGALFYYEFSISELIKGIKFYRNIDHSYALIERIHEALIGSHLLQTLKKFQANAIVYIPTHPLRRALRGTDLPSLYAEILGKKLNVPVKKLLRKKNFSSSLKKISKKSQRKNAVMGSMELIQSKIFYQRIIIVDDILTTGSTFEESKKTLKPVFGECRCVAIARTP
ncbi:MAG: ComF family protein [Myxococcales bacterium]|nr:ComF family protein [Myxococcales bacterium]USN49851.1 MAG: ComF family protein [Myxococcales bacterium]